jgi:hypothetical protein
VQELVAFREALLMAKPDGTVFQRGDTVRLNELRNANARSRDRKGVVVGPSRMKGRVRVLWNGLKRPQIVHAALLQLADSEAPTIGSREVVLATISEELEKIRDARFERHLRMPRERPISTHQPWSAQAPRNRRMVIGLTTASIAMGAAYMFIVW